LKKIGAKIIGEKGTGRIYRKERAEELTGK